MLIIYDVIQFSRWKTFSRFHVIGTRQYIFTIQSIHHNTYVLYKIIWNLFFFSDKLSYLTVDIFQDQIRPKLITNRLLLLLRKVKRTGFSKILVSSTLVHALRVDIISDVQFYNTVFRTVYDNQNVHRRFIKILKLFEWSSCTIHECTGNYAVIDETGHRSTHKNVPCSCMHLHCRHV